MALITLKFTLHSKSYMSRSLIYPLFFFWLKKTVKKKIKGSYQNFGLTAFQ